MKLTSQSAKTTLAALFTTIFLICTTVIAQQKQAAVSTSTLAIEIVDGDSPPRFQSPVLHTPQGGLLETSVRDRIAGWKKPDGVAPLERVRIQSVMEGEAVRIKVSAVFDDSYPADAPGPKYGRSVKQIASYLVREGQSVGIDELKNFGVVPMTLRVVRATPRLEESVIESQPNLINNLKSIIVISFEKESGSSNFYRLKLQNTTSKNIIALKCVLKESDEEAGETFLQSGTVRPLIAAGASFQTPVGGSGSGGRMTPQGYVPDPPRQKTFVIDAVVFDDGTYEGDVRAAAKLESWRKGYQIQVKRVLALIQNILDSSDNDAAALEKLKSQVSNLRIDVDPSAADAIISKYPNLPKDYSKTNVISNVMRNLTSVKEMALREIEDFNESAAGTNKTGAIREWLIKAKLRYEAMLHNFG